MKPERRWSRQRSPESLEERLRALPQPPLPDGLEARLLAAVPDRLPAPRRRWPILVGVAGVLAAACLLAVLAWPGRDRKDPIPSPQKSEIVHPDTPQPREEPDRLTARRDLDGEELPAFNWPLADTSPVAFSTAIPADLLD